MRDWLRGALGSALIGLELAVLLFGLVWLALGVLR